MTVITDNDDFFASCCCWKIRRMTKVVVMVLKAKAAAITAHIEYLAPHTGQA